MFQVETEGFSGPLDLLCELLETGELSFHQIRFHEIVILYIGYLKKKDAFSLDEIAQFCSLTSRLLYHKVMALLPSGRDQAEAWEEEQEELPVHELVEDYRPYRKAAVVMEQLFRERQRCFPRNLRRGSLFFDAGDLYLLSLIWWELFALYSVQQSKNFDDVDEIDAGYWDGVPTAIPEEGQVESRMEELRALLDGNREKPLSFLALLEGCRGRNVVVLTLLALLELCRKEEIVLSQHTMFGSIHVSLS